MPDRTNAYIDDVTEQIQELEARIAELQRRWKPYANAQPGVPGMQTGMGPYNPTLFLEKSEISLEIDRTQVELAQVKRRQAEQSLAVYEKSGGLPSAKTVYQKSQAAYEEAKQAWEAAEKEMKQARYALELQHERSRNLTKAVARWAADEKRWSSELARDQQLKTNVEGGTHRAANLNVGWRTVVGSEGP